MKDGGVIPVTGFPTCRRQGQARETTNIHGRIQHPNMHLIPHAFVHGRSSRGYTFEACISGGTNSQRKQLFTGRRGKQWYYRSSVINGTVVEVEVHDVLSKITAVVVVPMLSSNLMEPMSSRVIVGSSRTRELVGSTAMVVVHGACDSRFFGQQQSYASMNVRGRDMELDVHGVFEGRRQWYSGHRRRQLFYASGIKVLAEVLAVLSSSEDGSRRT